MDDYPGSTVEEIQSAFVSSTRKVCPYVPDNNPAMKCPRQTTNFIEACMRGPHREGEQKLAEHYREKI